MKWPVTLRKLLAVPVAVHMSIVKLICIANGQSFTELNILSILPSSLGVNGKIQSISVAET